MVTKNKNKKNTKLKEPKVEEDIKLEELTGNSSKTEFPDASIDEGATTENVEESGHKKSYRKRKKHYYNAIRNQMEFYFGDANLTKDRFLKQMIDKEPCM